MTSNGKLDRDGYLMMIQGLEQMANWYKHARGPTKWEILKRTVRDEGAAGLCKLTIQFTKEKRSAVRSRFRNGKRLLKESKYPPWTYLRYLNKGTHTRVIPGNKIYKLRQSLSYPPDRYFRDGKVAVYMAMFGSYDRIVAPLIHPDNIDYYVLTDKEMPEDSKCTVLNPEDYIPKNLLDNPILCNRWCKMHPHMIFPDYDASIYLDSNLLVVSDLTPFVTFLDSFPVAMFQHWKRDCVYQEVQTCIEGRRDTRSNLLRHEKRLRTQGIPEHWGLLEAPVIARMHRDERCIALMEAWWENFFSGSRRDQLSLIETLWQNKICPEQIGVLGSNIYLCNLVVKNSHREKVRKR